LDGDRLIVGGEFNMAGDAAHGNVAVVNLSNDEWTGLNGGTSGTVRAIEVDGQGNVYVGGDFTHAGGTMVDHIALWDGQRWQNVEDGVSNGVTTTTVYSIAAVGSALFVGGEFTLAGGIPVGHIVRWTSNWVPLGSGVGGALPSVRAVAADQNQVVVAGNFSTAGNKPSVNVGLFHLPTGIVRSHSIGTVTVDCYPNPFVESLTIDFSNVAKTSDLEISVHEVDGRRVASIHPSPSERSRGSVEWAPRGLPSGPLIVTVQSAHTVVNRIVVRNQ
jgi:hypothetical protein